MMLSLLTALLVLIGVCIELILPGRSLYHAGWYNVLLAALVVVLAMRMRRTLQAMQRPAERIGAIIAAFGVGVIAFAGIASGLLGPDAQTIVGAPGENVRVADLGGTLDFPLAQGNGAPVVSLVRGTSALPIDRTRYVGAFVLQPKPRDVVAVEASDARDAHLTITQPTGTAFLSPVLLMTTRQSLLGFDVPNDAFSLPAAHRMVRAVLFPAPVAAQIRTLGAPPGTAAVLFEVENDGASGGKNHIGVALDGGRTTIAGITLRPRVLSYPAITTIAIPHVVAVAIGLLCVLGGLLTALVPPGKLGKQ